MPLHDWSKVPSGLYHHFRQCWAVNISKAINHILPEDHSALMEPSGGLYPSMDRGNLTEDQIYAAKANRIAIKQRLSTTVAVIEIVSPGDKTDSAAVLKFVERAVVFLRKGIHLLVIDPFPPGEWDPFGMHKVIWNRIGDGDFEFLPEQDRLFVAYCAGKEVAAYVDSLSVGQEVFEMPVFLTETGHVTVPLGSTYSETWNLCPAVFRKAVETGELPKFDDE